MKISTIASLVVLLLSTCAFADESSNTNEIYLNPTVVSGNRLQQQLSEVMPSVSVITSEDIEREQPQDVGSILQNEPGIEVVRSGGLGAQTSIFMRGAASHSVLVLIDGLPFSDQVNNGIQLESIPISLVDRIEILRGNASALYGTGAAGGVIQIFTKNGMNTGSFGSMTFGSRGTENIVAGYAGKYNDTYFNIALNHQHTNGFATLNPAQNDPLSGNVSNPAHNSYGANNVSANISKTLAPGHEIGLKILATEFKTTNDSSGNLNYMNMTRFSPIGPGAGTAFAYDYLQQLESKTIFSQVYLKGPITNYWNSNITLGSSNTTTTTNYNSYDITGNPLGIFRTHQNNLSWVNDFIIAQNQTVLLGVQTQQTQASANNAYYGQSPFQAERSLNSIFSGYTAKFDAIGVQINGRYDSTNTGQSAATGLMGLSYDLTNHWKIAGNVSDAFILPTPYQLYAGPAMGGNPNLVPEHDNSQEISVQYIDINSLIRAVIFNRETTDLIGSGSSMAMLGCTTPSGYSCAHQLVNINKAKNSGIELSVKTAINKLSLKASATFQNPVNESNNTQLIRRAKDFGSLVLSYPIQKYTVGGEIFVTGLTPDIPVMASCPTSAPCVSNSGYSIVNLFASYKYDANWSAKLRVENLFNRSYESAYGFNTPGFGAFLTLQYSPGSSENNK